MTTDPNWGLGLCLAIAQGDAADDAEIVTALDHARQVYSATTVGPWLPLRAPARPRELPADPSPMADVRKRLGDFRAAVWRVEDENRSRLMGLLWSACVLWGAERDGKGDRDKVRKALDVMGKHLVTHWGIDAAPRDRSQIRAIATKATTQRGLLAPWERECVTHAD